MLVNVEAPCGRGERGIAHYGRVGNETHEATTSGGVTKHCIKLGMNSSAVALYK